MARVTREAWLAAGLQLLKETGAGALTIDRLSDRLGVTKGSFYHHFSSREAYSEALLTHWEEQLTHRLIAASSAGASFSERDLTLTRLGEELFDPELEVAIRAWALRDPAVMDVQERVDQQRIGYLQELFHLATNDADSAATLAVIRYAFYVGAQQVRPSLSPQRYTELLQRLQGALLATIEDDDSTPAPNTNHDGGTA